MVVSATDLLEFAKRALWTFLLEELLQPSYLGLGHAHVDEVVVLHVLELGHVGHLELLLEAVVVVLQLSLHQEVIQVLHLRHLYNNRPLFIHKTPITLNEIHISLVLQRYDFKTETHIIDKQQITP